MVGSLRILHLEDDPLDAELIQENLLAEALDCDIVRVQTRQEFFVAAEAGRFDVILADFSLPSFDGLSALTIAQEKCPDVPFIFVSGAIGEEMAIETLRKGATDYVLKDRLSRLGPAVRRALGEVEERNKRRQATEELRQSQSQLEAILQGITEGITVQKPDGSLLYANPAAARLIGYASPAELLATPVPQVVARFELLDEQGQPFPLSRLPGRRALEGQQPEEVLLRFRIHETGEERWSIVNASPVYDPQGQVQFAINIFRDITERMHMFEAERRARAQTESARQRLEFLSRASALLASSLDYEATLNRVAQLAVPEIADWCAVDLVQDDSTTRRVAVAHVDASKAEIAFELERRFPRDPQAPGGLPKVLRTGQPELYSVVSESLLEKVTSAPEHRQMVQHLGFNSAIVVPLKVRDQVIGALTLVTAESGRRFDEADLTLAEELAQRAAIAVDNARLYREATLLNEELERRVARRTEELQISNRQLEAEIHQHQQAAAALRKSQMQLAEAQRIARLGNWEWDVATNVVTGSEELFRIFGFDRETAITPHDVFLERVHPEDRAMIVEIAGAAIGKGEPFSFYYRIVRPDGSVRVIYTQGQVHVDGSGASVRVFGASQDVTELKQTEQALRQSQALYEAIAENLPNGAVLVVDRELRYLLARGPVLEQMGASPAQLEGKYVGDSWPAAMAQQRQACYRAAFAGQATTDEISYGGRSYFLHTVPLSSEDGEIYAALALSMDVTDRKEAEEMTQALLRRQQELSRKVVSAQEEERQRLSRELHDSAGQILTALHLNLSMLANEVAGNQALYDQIAEAVEMTRTAQEEIRAASHALRPPALDTLGLNETLKSLCRDFARQANLQIAYEGIDVPALSEQVSISFYRFLQETLTNVAKHAQASVVKVTLNSDGYELRLAVEDNGIGMLALNQQLFAAGRAGGVGLLGLRERFELIGGVIAVESWPEKGTRVAARYPMR